MKSFQKYIMTTTTLAAGILLSLSFPEEAAAEPILYEVQPGDTVFSSARSFGKSTQEVANLNGLADANSIQPGEILVIEGSENELTDLKADLSPAGFIDTVGDQAHTIAADHGLYASVMVAQAALESSFGNSTLASPPAHNLFGIKGGSGEETVTMSTTEYMDGQWLQPNETFKQYPNYGASMVDNAQLLRKGNTWDPAYYEGAWVENTESYADATESLEGRYATDPNYHTKLDNIIEEYDLTQFDSEEAKEPKKTETAAAAPKEESEAYKVSAGDTVYNISNRYGMTVSELKQMNNLSSNYIQRGQTIQVKQTEETIENTTTHTVSAKDTLYNIANRYGMTGSELQRLNGLNSNHIQLGQTLQVKDNPQATENTTTHTVTAKDTLYSLATRYGTTVSELKRLNQLSSNHIQTGQTLTVQAAAQTTHTVVPDDTLYNISNRYGLTVDELKAKNNLTSNAIQLGQELQL